jgi:hypothetical protein
VSGVELCDGFVHPQNSFQSFRFSREAREKISIHSLCAKENWKGKNDAMPPKVRMVAPDGKQVAGTFTPWPPLGPKMGEPSAYVPLEKLLRIRILFTECVMCVLIESETFRFVRR